MHLGGGWRLTHITDRVVELRKEDHAYRRLIGRDGYVLVRAEPGMTRHTLIDTAKTLAQANDKALAERVANQLMPRRTAQYQLKQQQLAPIFGIPGEEPTEKVYSP